MKTLSADGKRPMHRVRVDNRFKIIIGQLFEQQSILSTPGNQSSLTNDYESKCGPGSETPTTANVHRRRYTDRQTNAKSVKR